MSTATNIRQAITARIVEAIKSGTPPWRKPWSSGDTAGVPKNAVSKRRYSGVNVLLLEMAKMQRGFLTNWWGTFAQWNSLGGSVRKRPDHIASGGWGTKIVLFKPGTRTITNKDGEEEQVRYAVLRQYTVFNLDQTEGILPARFGVGSQPSESFVDYDPAEGVVTATKADIRHGGDRAAYFRAGDYIEMPDKLAFKTPANYYETMFHELAHWSESRLGWSGSYALAELVAEMAACYLSSAVRIPQSDDLANHAAYLDSWLKEFQSDPNALWRVTTQASKAADFILSFSESQESEETTPDSDPAQVETVSV